MCETQKKDENSVEVCQEPVGTTVNNLTTTTGVAAKEINKVNFEVALTETQFGKFNYFLIIVCGVVLSNVLLETLGISFVLPVSDCDLNLTTNEKGLLSAIGFVGIICSSQLWGFLADTKGRRCVIRPTLILGFMSTVLSSFLNSFWWLIVVRFINGFLISGGSATIYAYLGEFHATKTRSRAIMGASVIFGFGAMLLPAIAWLVINQTWSFYIPYINVYYKPWRLFMVVCGLPGIISALCLFKLPESPKFVLLHNKHEETIEILQRIYAINTGKCGTEYPISAVYDDDEINRVKKISTNKSNPILGTLESMWNQTAPLFQTDLLRKTVLASVLQFGLYFTANGMYMWFPNILNQIGVYSNEHPGHSATICEIFTLNTGVPGLNETLSAPGCKETLDISTYEHSLVLEIMYSVGFTLMGVIINKVGKIPILFVITVGCGICGIAAIYVTIPLLATYLFVILMVCGCGITVVNAATVEMFPTSLRAMAVCISLMMGRLGSVAGANLLGALLDTYCEGAFLLCGISLIICGFIGFMIPKEPKGAKNEPSRRLSLISVY